MKSASTFSSPKQSPNDSPRTSSKTSQSNSRKSISATPTKNSPKKLKKNSQANSQTNSPATKNSSQSSSRNSQNNSQASSPIKKSPNAKKIQELRLLHKNAIDNLDFAEAESIDKKISELKSENISEQLSKIKAEFGESIKTVINLYKNNLQDLENSKEDSIYSFRCQINNIFENLKSKQMKEMVELEKVYAHDRLRETQRIFPQYKSIILQAKSAGVLHDYKSALELQNSALLVSQSMLDKRLVLIDKDYELKNEALLQKHTKEVILLVRRLEDGIKKVEDKIEASLNQEKTFFDSKLINEYKKASRKIQLLTADFSPILQEIDQILYSTLTENEMEIPRNLCESIKNSSKPPLSNSPK